MHLHLITVTLWCLKFDEIYASANTCGLGIFLCGKELWFCHLLCDIYFVYMPFKNIFLSRVIPNSSTASDN